MSLVPTTVTENPYQPGIAAGLFVPDQLIAGDLKIVSTNGTIAQNSTTLARGTVMGQVTATGKWVPCVKTASDGSQNPTGILADTCNATAGDAQGGVYVQAEINFNSITFDASWGTGTAAFAALDTALRANANIFLKQVATAASPT